MVMTGGMLAQHADTVEVIESRRSMASRSSSAARTITSSPGSLSQADFQVLGEAEGILEEFIEAWTNGERKGVFEAEKFKADVTKSPIPRFDLLKFEHYLHVGVQFSRGCPFTCEFCDIIELYGRVPRTKTTPQMLAELDALYALGYRGHIDFVDDNLIGNKKAVKAFLPHLSRWLEEHDYPFEFSTEASLNLADDDELLRLMSEANFFGVFVGIESPDPETLVADAEEAEHAAQHRRKHPQDLRARHVRDGRLHRRLRQRESCDRRNDDRFIEECCDPGLPWSGCSTRCPARS